MKKPPASRSAIAMDILHDGNMVNATVSRRKGALKMRKYVLVSRGLSLPPRLAIVLFTLLFTSCMTTERARLLEDQVSTLIIPEAQRAFEEVFQASFDANKSHLLVGDDLQKWLRSNPDSIRHVPDDLATLAARNQAIALLIHDALPGKTGVIHDVIYLRPATGRGPRRFLVAQPDPCGDGNPAMCEACSDCSGESSPGGTIATCVCAMACDGCRACRKC
jgi:hypothetical protein